jgi:hypothetical protein
MSARRGNLTSWESPTLNSLECWDYSIELECLQGPEGKTNLFLNNSIMAYDIFTLCAANRNKLHLSKTLFYLCFRLRQLNTCIALNLFLRASPSSSSSSDSSSCSFNSSYLRAPLSFHSICTLFLSFPTYSNVFYYIFDHKFVMYFSIVSYIQSSSAAAVRLLQSPYVHIPSRNLILFNKI